MRVARSSGSMACGDGVELRVAAGLSVAQERPHVHGVGQLGSLVHDDDVLQAGLFANGGELLVLLAGGNKGDARLGVLQYVQDLLGGLGGVDGDDDGAQQQGGVVGDGPLRAVLAEDDHTVAFTNAPGLQLASCGIHPAPQLSGGNGLPDFAFARQHHAVVVTVYDGEENLIEGPNVHVSECFSNRDAMPTTLLQRQNASLASTRKL